MSDDPRLDALRARLESTDSYDHALATEATKVGDGVAHLEMEVTRATANPLGNLHGGAIATLVDKAGTFAIMSADRQGRPGVTTDLNVSYFAPAALGAKVVAEATVLKIGKTLAFVTVDVRRKADGALVAQGRMTKFQGG